MLTQLTQIFGFTPAAGGDRKSGATQGEAFADVIASLEAEGHKPGEGETPASDPVPPPAPTQAEEDSGAAVADDASAEVRAVEVPQIGSIPQVQPGPRQGQN